MRQAGRYLPEYNATRARAGSFLALAKTPALATEVTLQPLERFPLDAAILFSDILTVPDAMGLGLAFAEGEGPRFERPLRDEAEIMKLRAPDPGAELRYVIDAVREIRRALAGRVPLIGFSGSPFTLACYMVEGSGSSDWRQLKTMLHARPDLLHRILDVNARAVADYLNAQIDAGAQVVMLFDTWGGILAHDGLRNLFALLCAAKSSSKSRACRRSCSPRAARRGSAAMMQSGLRCDRPRLDERSCHRTQACRRTRRTAGQSRSGGAVCTAEERARGRAHACSMHSAPRRDTFSISATESRRKRRSIRFLRW